MLTSAPINEPIGRDEDRSRSVSAAQAADILALARAAIDSVGRALRSAPEIRESRVMARWPIDLEDLLLELQSIRAAVPIAELAARLGVSTAQLRSTALRLQRMSLVSLGDEGVSLTANGRQKLGRLEAARASVIRRLATSLSDMTDEEAQTVSRILMKFITGADEVIDDQLGHIKGRS